jgi:pSer/pThr/pTyr-binding forkhead associated (FHA) protein
MSSNDTSLALRSNPADEFALACKSTGPLLVVAKHRTSGEEKSYSVAPPFVFIGRSPAAGVRLDDPSVSQCHAYLQVIEGAVYCIDLGSRTGVLWEDGSQGCGWVKNGQTLQLGAFDVQIDAPQSSGHPIDLGCDLDGVARDLLSIASVEIHTRANQVGRPHSLDRPITLIGRHPSCHLRFLDESIGYFQCALVNNADGVWYVDTLSRHGSLLNGRRCRVARVHDADLIEIGKISLLFHIGTHAHESQLALNETISAPAVVGNVDALPGKIAEAMAGVFMPVGEMMKQFQQSFVSMTQMFTSMQQDHALLVKEQIQQIREMAEELRVLRATVRAETTPALPPTPVSSSSTGSATPAPPAEAKGAVKISPRSPIVNGSAAEGDALPDAHAWFMKRLANKDQVPPSKS